VAFQTESVALRNAKDNDDEAKTRPPREQSNDGPRRMTAGSGQISVRPKPAALSWVNPCPEGVRPEVEELYDAGTNSNEGRGTKRDEGPEIEEDKRINGGKHTDSTY
jgi:hypothetical protein